MTITEFCDKHSACSEGRMWAIGTGCETLAELWQRDDMKPEWREWIATRSGVLTDRELRLYACWRVRQIWHLLSDERSRHAVEVAERHARGQATDSELAAAAAAAWAAAAARAARAASRAGARAAREAAEAAETAWTTGAAAREAAGEAWAAARAAAARAVARAAREAAEAEVAQSEWLLANTKPNFNKQQ